MRRLATWQRLVRAAFLPLLLGLPSLFFVVDATRRASLTSLGRDQGIFQYIAWAVEQPGMGDYYSAAEAVMKQMGTVRSAG